MTHYDQPVTGFTQAIWADAAEEPVEELGSLTWDDGQFIAAARTALPRLLADVERLEKIREAAERYVNLVESAASVGLAEAWAALRKVLEGE